MLLGSRRPRFEIECKRPRSEVLEKIKVGLRADKSLRGMVLPYGRVEITFSPEEQKLWTPQLIVDFEEAGEGTTGKAKFTPPPNIWTMYLAIYGIAGIAGLAAFVYGMAQLALNRTPTGLYLAPAVLLFAGLVYGAAFVGQGLGSDQMFRLRRFVEDICREPCRDTKTAEG